jgi:hypothetical protein
MSSLAWADNDRMNSALTRRENIVYTTLSMHLEATVAETTHIPEKLNIIHDELSRLLTPSELGLDSTLEYDASNDKSMLEFLQLCDPDAALDTIESHINLPASVTYLTLFHVTADKQVELRKSLLNGGLVLAQCSVALSTQCTYNNTWKKWIIFMQTCDHNPTAAQLLRGYHRQCTDFSTWYFVGAALSIQYVVHS